MKTQRLVASQPIGAIPSRIHIENPESMEEKRPHTNTNNPLVCFLLKSEKKVLHKTIHNP
mgnify:CR=1 FL=1